VVRRRIGVVGEGGSAAADLGDDVVSGGFPDEGFWGVIFGPYFSAWYQRDREVEFPRRLSVLAGG
jgi:hypothetical protein